MPITTPPFAVPSSLVIAIAVTSVANVNCLACSNAFCPVEPSSTNRTSLGAADTFRAAAVEQLDIWGGRVGVPVVKQKMGADPASVAYDTLSSAVANNADVVIIDTAGRLHNKVGLMNELTKIKNVMKKVVPDAPNEVLLVLDGKYPLLPDKRFCPLS